MRIGGLLILLVAGFAHGLDNGLALTPPMGWLAWERFRCNVDCENDPLNCISETLFMEMADLMYREGYSELGYNIVSLDDCWLDHSRDANGRLQPDPKRFPSGIKALADYMHERNLKFGIYQDYGNYTCAGYPGILGHLETDAQTFADWGVDYVKLDGCYAKPEDMDEGYPAFGAHLNKTGRPMVYSCSWPDYQIGSGMTPNYTAITNTCNLWRNFNDIQDSWSSVTTIIDHYGDEQDHMVPNAGPGHWNDPDMLIIGNFGLSYDQCKTQMAIWCILAAPLLMSTDLRTIRYEHKEILQNVDAIEVNQDPLGIQGRRIYKENSIEIWSKPITPVQNGNHSYAFAFVNRREDGTPFKIVRTLRSLGLTWSKGYHVMDVFDYVSISHVLPDDELTMHVVPSGVVMLKCKLALAENVV